MPYGEDADNTLLAVDFVKFFLRALAERNAVFHSGLDSEFTKNCAEIPGGLLLAQLHRGGVRGVLKRPQPRFNFGAFILW
jgi:hypothetical protein